VSVVAEAQRKWAMLAAMLRLLGRQHRDFLSFFSLKLQCAVKDLMPLATSKPAVAGAGAVHAQAAEWWHCGVGSRSQPPLPTPRPLERSLTLACIFSPASTYVARCADAVAAAQQLTAQLICLQVRYYALQHPQADPGCEETLELLHNWARLQAAQQVGPCWEAGCN